MDDNGMIKTVYDNMVDIIADEGKELYRASDGLRAKRVTRPVESEEWVEIDDGEEMPNEYEAALTEIESTLNG